MHSNIIYILTHSDYWWSNRYELGLAALIIVVSVVWDALGEVTSVDTLQDVQWWHGVLTSAGVAAINFIRSQIPPRSNSQ